VRGMGVGVWYGVLLCWAGGLLRVRVKGFRGLGCIETYLG